MRIAPPIRGVFLDIGWTMNAPASGDWMIPPAFFEAVDKARYDAIPQARLEAAFAQGMRFLDENHLVRTEAEELEQFKAYYRMVFGLLPELGLSEEAAGRVARDKVLNDGQYVFYDDVKPALAELKRTYRLGIISDTWPSARRVLENAGLFNCFDSVTFSCHLGIFKPHPGMYRHALSALGLPPPQTVFVDDSIENLEGARAQGIQPIRIARKEGSGRRGPFVTIGCFSELIERLRNAGQGS